MHEKGMILFYSRDFSKMTRNYQRVQIVCCSVKNSAESNDDSRPTPLCFIPPKNYYLFFSQKKKFTKNFFKIFFVIFEKKIGKLPKGIVKSRTSQQFVQMVAAWIFFATRFARLIFSVQSVAQSPYFVSQL